MIDLDAGKTNSQGVGVMIVEEFLALDPGNFIRAACSHQEFPQFVYATWRDLTRRPQTLATEIPFLYCLTSLQKHVFHLFGFPEALSRSFFLHDLLFPVKFHRLGFVVILDTDVLHQYRKSHSLSKMRDPTKSALFWTLAHNLPFVVVAKAQDVPPVFPMEELRSILELSADVAICHCASKYGSGLVQQVLSRLLEQFQTFQTH